MRSAHSRERERERERERDLFGSNLTEVWFMGLCVRFGITWVGVVIFDISVNKIS